MPQGYRRRNGAARTESLVRVHSRSVRAGSKVSVVLVRMPPWARSAHAGKKDSSHSRLLPSVDGYLRLPHHWLSDCRHARRRWYVRATTTDNASNPWKRLLFLECKMSSKVQKIWLPTVVACRCSRFVSAMPRWIKEEALMVAPSFHFCA
jgi:hypothetical protein